MIRKFLRVFRVTVVVGLTLGAALTLGCGIVGFFTQVEVMIPDRPLFVVGEQQFVVVFVDGRVNFWRYTVVDTAQKTRRTHWVVLPQLRLVVLGCDESGFTFPNSAPNAGVHMKADRILVGLLLPVVLFGAYPSAVFYRGPLRRHRRRKRGLCLACGYNLTGNTSGTCPECGRATTS